MEFRFVNNKKEKITKDCLKTALLIYFFTISVCNRQQMMLLMKYS